MDAATIRSEIAEALLKGDRMTNKSSCAAPDLRAFTILIFTPMGGPLGPYKTRKLAFRP
jgi:hypothetical protein